MEAEILAPHVKNLRLKIAPAAAAAERERRRYTPTCVRDPPSPGGVIHLCYLSTLTHLDPFDLCRVQPLQAAG